MHGKTIEHINSTVDVEFVEVAFHKYYEELHRYAYTLLKDNESAKDTVQQVFITLWEKKESIDIRVSVKSYLFRAVFNQCMNLHTRGRRHQPLTPFNQDHWHAPAQLSTESKELMTLINQAIETLPPQCKLIFLKSRMEGSTYPAIARDLGISIKTVEAQMTKALKILRKLLQHYKFLIYAALSWIEILNK